LNAESSTCTRCNLFPIETTLSIGTSCTCAPGFFYPDIANLNRFAFYNLTILDAYEHPLSVLHRQTISLYLDEYPILKTHNIDSKTSPSTITCVLCPPNFYCIGGNALIQIIDNNYSSYTFLPVGAHTQKSWLPCPLSQVNSQYVTGKMRVTNSIGLGSCFQNTETWKLKDSLLNLDLQSYTVPGILFFNMTGTSATKNTSILSDIFRRKKKIMETNLFINTKKDITIRYTDDEKTGEKFYVVFLDINIVKVVQSAIHQLYNLQENHIKTVERIDMGTGAAYNVIIQTMWALLVNGEFQNSHNIEAVVVIPGLVKNPTTETITVKMISLLTTQLLYQIRPRVVFILDYQQVL
jgi:hypothetical protein